MPAAGETVRVEGLRELNRAFALASREVAADMRGRLREVAEPVRSDAESIAVATIRRIGIPWSRMRVGVTQSSVYVAPRQRGTRLPNRKRPGLAPRLLNAELSALARNESRVVAGVEGLLDEVGRDWERA